MPRLWPSHDGTPTLSAGSLPRRLDSRGPIRRLATDRLAGLDVGGNGEWGGRVIVVEPSLVRKMAGIAQSRFLLGRLRALGGELTIASVTGGGSRLDILLPDEAR